MIEIIARVVLLVATLLLMNLLITSVAQHVLEINKPGFERAMSETPVPNLATEIESYSMKDLIPSLWRSEAGASTLKLLVFLALSIFALVILRVFSTSEEIRRIIALLFPIGIVLLPLGMILAYYIPNNLGAATALTGAVSLIIAIIQASVHLHGGTKN